MRLQRLCKSGDSGEHGECPALYLAEHPTTMVAQGPVLDAVTTAELQELGEGEGGVTVPTETVLRAAALFLAGQGRPAMVAEVDAFLAGWEPGR